MQYVKLAGGALMHAAGADNLAHPEYKTLKTYGKEGSQYDHRHYSTSRWVSTKFKAISFRGSIGDGFNKCFRYISGKNDKDMKLDMTVPVLTKVEPGAGPNCESTFTTSFFIDDKVTDIPQPTEEDVFIEEKPEMDVYVRRFSGFARKDEDWINESEKLISSVTVEGHMFHDQPYYYVGYDAPFKLVNRRNEIWLSTIDSETTMENVGS